MGSFLPNANLRNPLSNSAEAVADVEAVLPGTHALRDLADADLEKYENAVSRRFYGLSRRLALTSCSPVLNAELRIRNRMITSTLRGDE